MDLWFHEARLDRLLAGPWRPGRWVRSPDQHGPFLREELVALARPENTHQDPVAGPARIRGVVMANVLVTGGAGYVGSVCCAELLRLGHSVTIVDDLSTGCRDAVPAGAAFFPLDIGNQ